MLISLNLSRTCSCRSDLESSAVSPLIKSNILNPAYMDSICLLDILGICTTKAIKLEVYGA